jgi:hypothetical protein
MFEVLVRMNTLELKLFRRALAKAADEGLLDATVAVRRICELDVLRWEAEEATNQPAELPLKRRMA